MVIGSASYSVGPYVSMLFVNIGGTPNNWVPISYVSWD
jgi:hypothetical protein